MSRRRWAWALVALGLVAGGVWRAQRRPDALLAQLASGPTRAIDARLASPALDRARPLGRADERTGERPHTPVSLATLAALESRGDARMLAEAQLVAGRAADAARTLARTRDDDAHGDAAVDRAAIALALG
ncbi:MAG TPA: hypothetical protein VHB97_19070, partial [Polyangia bacterium]|nr:hypothetical protein [Polyangia bacterium]